MKITVSDEFGTRSFEGSNRDLVMLVARADVAETRIIAAQRQLAGAIDAMPLFECVDVGETLADIFERFVADVGAPPLPPPGGPPSDTIN